MSENKAGIERYFVYYYGLLQTAHLTSLIISGVRWLSEGDLGILALPPDGGWSDQAVHLLLSIGLVDFFVAIGALVFVVYYIRRREAAVVLGSVTLSGTIYSAVVYAYGAVASGAWVENPLPYSIIAILFAPALMLAVLFIGCRVFRAQGC
jgi:hypothetical protein